MKNILNSSSLSEHLNLWWVMFLFSYTARFVVLLYIILELQNGVKNNSSSLLMAITLLTIGGLFHTLSHLPGLITDRQRPLWAKMLYNFLDFILSTFGIAVANAIYWGTLEASKESDWSRDEWLSLMKLILFIFVPIIISTLFHPSRLALSHAGKKELEKERKIKNG